MQEFEMEESHFKSRNEWYSFLSHTTGIDEDTFDDVKSVKIQLFKDETKITTWE